MLPLAVDPVTGFLESRSNNHFTFNAEKKQRFLDLAMNERREGRFPDFGLLCDQVGISMTAVDRHLRDDPKFKELWDEIVLRTDAAVMRDCWDLRKKNPMYLFGLMRRIMPQRWHPEPRQSVSVDINVAGTRLDKSEVYDAELVQRSAVINEGDALIQNSTATPYKEEELIETQGQEIPHPPSPSPALSPPHTTNYKNHTTESKTLSENPNKNIKSEL